MVKNTPLVLWTFMSTLDTVIGRHLGGALLHWQYLPKGWRISMTSTPQQVSCSTCPNYRAGGQPSNGQGALVTGWCHAHGEILTTLNMKTCDIDTALAERAAHCQDHGVPKNRATWQTLAFAEPKGAQGPSEFPKARSCYSCKHRIEVADMRRSFGIGNLGCSIRGQVILPGCAAQEARSCAHAAEAFSSSAGTDEVSLIPMLDKHVWRIYMNGTVKEREMRDHVQADPLTVSDAPASPEDVALGIRAWKRVSDPEDASRSVLLPVFDPEAFDDADRAKIPRPGDDEHPELYNDHQGLAYKLGVLWLKLGETPALNGPAGTGKGHPVDTKVLTLEGWRRIGDLRTGDEVVGSDGRATKVTGVYPRGRLHVNRVTMTDGASVLVDDDHLWSVKNHGKRIPGKGRRGRHEVVATRDLSRPKMREAGYRYSIPLVAPVEYPERALPLDPYVLGVLLANGALQTDATYSTNDAEVSTRVGATYPQTCRGHYTATRWALGNETWTTLRQLGLAQKKSAHKFIPEQYLRASVRQRKALLNALLDCDGSCDGKHTMYHTVSQYLADGVIELVRSLGGTASQSRSTRDGAIVVAISLPFNPFTLPRKARQWEGVTHRQPQRRIASVQDAGEAEVVCISVAAEDQLYVTEDYIVTHNTEAFRYLAYLMQLPFERFSITASTELDDLAGRWVLRAGSSGQETVFQYGRLPLAWKRPCVIVLDEPNTGAPEVWQFVRPLTDNSKQMVLDMNAGERILRHQFAFLGMAFNPAWDIRNSGAHEIADADGSRLMHISMPYPDKTLERSILRQRCEADGYKIDADTVRAIVDIATDLRGMAGQKGSLSVSWGTRQTIKVARATRYFSLRQAHRLAAADLLDPAESEQILAVVATHDKNGITVASKKGKF